MKMNWTIRTLFSIIQYTYLVVYRIYSLIYRKKPSKIPPTENPLFTLSATTLARKIRQREITSYEVVYAYTERIKEVNRLLNAVVENRYRSAIIEAKICDEQLAAGKVDVKMLEEKMPLYGVPITIKECCAVKGLSHTGCSLTRKGVKATADSTIVKLLRNAGAIPLCVTNTPEQSSNIDTSNLLYGTTFNPYDIRYSAGGSSGGEGALLGSGASLIGIGSDLLGSVRIPALFNGVFGHKPTSKIVPIEGHIPESDDEVFLSYVTFGPMTRYAEDLNLLMRVLTSTCNHDLRLTVPVDLKQLKVYYLQSLDESFGMLPISPNIEQCVLKAANHFKERDIHTEKLPIDWPVTQHEITIVGILNIKKFPQLIPSSDLKIRKNPSVEMMKAFFCKSQHTISAILFTLLLKTHFLFTKSDISYYTQHAEQLRQNLLDVLGEDGVFIYPTLRRQATFLRFALLEFINVAYCGIFNIFGFPAVHVPMGLDPDGLPIGVQVIAAPYQDRLCLAVAEELEKAFGGWTPPPFSNDDCAK
ncbi:PREDICTED: fatty-acid amide hydrolase 2-A-like [Dinoponera quadriceps]|uniref:Fatty-acid amide hydrolase 2-A-like n=1 Tax=Dinoponera quadriceps TaxID=609295 RepID=A0A6P3X4H0_DINQU|nr:PREDICTED: fatty-acid amide hydrolase 2-A-like [Dinoponera quadriceps]